MERKIDFGIILKAVYLLAGFNLIMLISMSVFRIVFFSSYAPFPELKGLTESVLRAFFLGVRFDLVVVCYVNILVTLSIFAVWALGNESIFKRWAKILAYYYWALFSFVFFVLFVDYAYYSYFKDHINILIFDFFEDDTRALISTIGQNQKFLPFIAVLAVLLSGIFIIAKKTSALIEKIGPGSGKRYNLIAKIAFVVILLCAVGLGARGSLRMFPLNPIDAEISSNGFINKLSLNGVITLRKALKYLIEERKDRKDLTKRLGYDNEIEKAMSDFTGIDAAKIKKEDIYSYIERKTSANHVAEKLKPNVVLIVMESFGENLLRYQSPEFDVLGELKKHFDSDYVFYNFLPSGLLTIHALETIVLNIPQRPYSPAITQSAYAYLDYPFSAVKPFKKAGYSSVLVYGGGLNWRELSAFFPAQGFDKLIGEGAMQENAQKNQWGVYDEYFFNALYKELESVKGPIFILGMTTGNHPPYSVPDSYIPGPLNMPDDFRKAMADDEKSTRKRLITYQYANQKLGEFITKVKNSSLGKNTIIAVTGDHNFWDIFTYKDEELFYKYSAPFYVYVPAGLRSLKPDTSTFGSHVDIMPTLYNIALSNTQYLSMGKNLFDKKESHEAYNIDGFIISKDGAAKYNLKTGRSEFFSIKSGNGMFLEPSAPDEKKNKLVQYYKAAMAVTDYLLKETEKKIGGKKRLKT